MKLSATTACRHSSSKGASIINKNAPLISMSLHLSPPPIALPPHSKSFSPLLHSPSLFCPSLPFSVSQILHNPIRFWMLRTEPKPRASERTAGTPQPQGHREARERERGGRKGEGFRAFSDLDSTTTETRRFSNSWVSTLLCTYDKVWFVFGTMQQNYLKPKRQQLQLSACTATHQEPTNIRFMYIVKRVFKRVLWDIDHKKF